MELKRLDIQKGFKHVVDQNDLAKRMGLTRSEMAKILDHHGIEHKGKRASEVIKSIGQKFHGKYLNRISDDMFKLKSVDFRKKRAFIAALGPKINTAATKVEVKVNRSQDEASASMAEELRNNRQSGLGMLQSNDGLGRMAPSLGHNSAGESTHLARPISPLSGASRPENGPGLSFGLRPMPPQKSSGVGLANFFRH